MTVVLGPNFGNELIAAGLGGLPFSWGADGVFGRANLTTQQNTALDAVVAKHNPLAPAVPQFAPAVQARLVLSSSGKRTAVETAVNASSSDVQDYWHYASQFQRTHPIILQMAQGLGWSSSDLDTLFIAAATIT